MFHENKRHFHISTYIGRTEIASQVEPANKILISVFSSNTLKGPDRTSEDRPREILNERYLTYYYFFALSS